MEKTAEQRKNDIDVYTTEAEARIAEQERTAEKAAKGDKAALARLCEQIATAVLFRTTKMLRNHVDAEDAAQEVLIRVCKSIGKLKNPKTFRKWLGTIIVNEVRRKSMQNTRLSDKVVHLSDLLETATEEDEHLPEQIAMTFESRKAVIDAIDRLPQRQREAVILHYYDRLNVTETSEAMGISQPAASIHLKAACLKIKSDLEASANKFKKIAYGLMPIPLGDMLSHSLHAEQAIFTPTDQAWLPMALAKCGELAMAGVAVVGAGGTSSTSSPMASAAKVLLTIVASAATTLAITAGAILWHSLHNERRMDSRQTYTGATGHIVFTSEGEKGYINPTSASAQSDSQHGELRVIQWRITTADSGTAKYIGEGNPVDENIFASMREDELFGNYELIFILEDEYGNKYELAHNFFLLEKGILH